MTEAELVFLQKVGLLCIWVAYFMKGLLFYVDFKDSFKRTRYDVLLFVFFLPITGTLWTLGKIHDFMKKEI